MPNAAYLRLPDFARAAVDRLQHDNALRTVDQLNALLDAYAKTSGAKCRATTRRNAYVVAARCFLMPPWPVAR